MNKSELISQLCSPDPLLGDAVAVNLHHALSEIPDDADIREHRHQVESVLNNVLGKAQNHAIIPGSDLTIEIEEIWKEYSDRLSEILN